MSVIVFNLLFFKKNRRNLHKYLETLVLKVMQVILYMLIYKRSSYLHILVVFLHVISTIPLGTQKEMLLASPIFHYHR